MRFHHSGERAKLLDGSVDGDDLAVYIVAEFLECLGNLYCCYAAEDGACGRGFCTDGEVQAFQRLAEFFCLGALLCNLVGALFLILFKLLYGALRSDDCFAGGDEVFAALAILYLYYIVFVAQIGHIFFQYKLHVEFAVW